MDEAVQKNAKVTSVLCYKAMEKQLNLRVHEIIIDNIKSSDQLSFESSDRWLACFKR